MPNSPESPGEALTSVPKINNTDVFERSASARNFLSKVQKLAGRATLAISLTLGSAGAISSEIYDADSNPVLAEEESYPWGSASHVPQPPAYDKITWGYKDKATCDNKSSSYNCGSSKVGDWYFRDQWGYDLRNCTSYAAWKVAKEFGVHISSDWGNADTWDDKAQMKGYTVDGMPEPGDLAVWDSMHVAFVEEVRADGMARVSEYNQKLDGNFQNNRWVRANHYIDINGTGNIWKGSSTPKQPEKFPYAAVAEGQELYSDEGFVYTRVGGSAWPIKPKKDWNSGDKTNWGGDPIGPVPVSEVHDHEAGFGSANAHPPVDGTAVYQEGTSQQWYFTKGRAYPIGSGELDDLGVRNKALRIPFGRLPGFEYGLVPFQNGDLYRYAGGNSVRQFFTKPNSNVDESYWVNNETVLDCLEQTYDKRVNVLPQSAKPYVGKGWGTTELSQPSSCTYPSGMVLRGPGGIEQWRITGNNTTQPYQRRYFPTSLITYLHTSGNPQNRVMRSAQALNGVPQGSNMELPNGIFFVDKGNNAQFKIENGVFRPIPSAEMNKCLGNKNPVFVPGSVVGPVPQGSPMTCAFENRVFHRPDGRAYYVEGGRKHSIGTPAVRDCISVRKGAGQDIEVANTTADQYVDSSLAYCPYEQEPGLNFVQENGDPTVWLVNSDGTKRHVGQNCVVDPYTTQHKKFRIHIVPQGETAGHTKTSDFFGNPTNCGQLPG